MNSYKDTHETRIALLEQSIININETMTRIEKKMDEGFKAVDARFDGINSLIWTNFRWIIAIHLASIVGLVGIMANGFKWFHA